jgi:hypothetical protein
LIVQEHETAFHRMSRLERVTLGLAVGIACPLVTFVVCWWTAAAFHRYVSQLPTGVIVAVALAGLELGCLLDVLFLGRWVKGFYAVNVRLMAGVYLGLGAIAFGLFMGLPAGTFLLGVAAGIYMGRRARHIRNQAVGSVAPPHSNPLPRDQERELSIAVVRPVNTLGSLSDAGKGSPSPGGKGWGEGGRRYSIESHPLSAGAAQVSAAFHQTAVFAALLTAGTALPIGLLALRSEKQILRSLEATLGLDPNRLEGAAGLMLVIALCLLLFGMQYWCTRMAGHLAFRIGADDLRQSISTNG